ncbi:hypothetical protein AEA09_09665 [Lysinibacillus contaminans]|uniref:DUF5068 domain-containing protein n=1 Tax=Lysinibacillus contaminans TaxID=1293441 RepID=A0ABR5K1N4_9BACI|nr:DUF5068 domain-containing protein [Lysinibacillus contaminans]KOS68779.1 hypothetical protein AEA09_09665 [Lysinibacillus contaminans]
MKRKLLLYFSLCLITVLMVSGCAKSEEETKKEVSANADQEKPEKEDKEDKEDENKETASSHDFSSLIQYMEKETQGTTKVLYENNTPQVHKMEGVSISLDAYTLIELKDFHTDFSIPFGRETDGGVILAKYTVKNDMDKDVYYMPTLDITFTGAEKVYTNYKDLLPKEEQLPTKLSHATDYLLKAGEEVSGYFAYPFSATDLGKINELATVAVMVTVPFAEKGDFGSGFGSKGRFELALNAEGAEKVSSNAVFYQDKASMENMGDKKMLKEKSSINDSKQLGDVNVTLDGYQFTAFTPNEVEAPRFTNFKNGIVLLTTKFKLDNKGTSEIGLSSMTSKLTVNDGSQYSFGEGMLLNYGYNDIIKPGEAGELLQVYVLDQEQYEKIWKEKSFEIEIGPIKTQKAEDISKGKKATFTLPK